MELYEVVNTQYAFPVGVVLICAVLVFVFGFKSVEQPVFPHLSQTADDRKQTAGKKRKVKDKKSQPNGPVPSDDSSPEVKQKESASKQANKHDKDKSPAKEAPAPRRERKQEVAASESPAKDKNAVARSRGKENQAEEVKNRKNEKNLAKLLKQEEKPVDFDEGEWEQALSRKDKKNRKKDELIEESTPTKKESPSKKKKSAKNTVLAATDNKLQEDLEGKSSNKKEQEEVEVKKDVLIESTQALNTDNSILEKQTTEVEKESADAAGKAKKKNKKKPTTNNINNKVASEPTPASVPKKQREPVIELDLEPPEPVGAVVFDELGDVWKEARVPKKSKKKVRREQ